MYTLVYCKFARLRVKNATANAVSFQATLYAVSDSVMPSDPDCDFHSGKLAKTWKECGVWRGSDPPSSHIRDGESMTEAIRVLVPGAIYFA